MSTKRMHVLCCGIAVYQPNDHTGPSLCTSKQIVTIPKPGVGNYDTLLLQFLWLGPWLSIRHGSGDVPIELMQLGLPHTDLHCHREITFRTANHV